MRSRNRRQLAVLSTSQIAMLHIFCRGIKVTSTQITTSPTVIRHLHSLYTQQRKQRLTHNVFLSRNIFGFDPTKIMGSRSKEYSENKVLGYSMEELYDVVANVDDYKNFVPWCRESTVFEKSESHARANLVVGFPPIVEKYTSVITLARPNLAKSECLDGSMFNHLVCDWKISQGPKDIPRSCTLNFYISFEFKSLLYSQLSSMFFDEVVRKMVNAFEGRCETLYGPGSVIHTRYDPTKMKKLASKRRKLLASNKKFVRESS